MKKYMLNKYTSTIRKYPENYWVCSIVDNKIVFDSWEGCITKMDKVLAYILFYSGLIKSPGKR